MNGVKVNIHANVACTRLTVQCLISNWMGYCSFFHFHRQWKRL